jgi:Mg-chelatase subunit ChlD
MIGGPSGFGAGQWFRTPVQDVLPVDMEVMPKDQESNVALVLALDKSGSMSSGSDAGSSRPSALSKVDIAKNAVMQASAVLGNSDLVGIVAFDSGARWALEVQPYPSLLVLEEAISSITADGGTDIFAGLTLAEEGLRGAEAKIKHIILLTDGHSNQGDHQALAARFAEEGITLSVVAAGIDSARDLVWLAEQGGGRYYPAVAIEDVPQIFLKETIRIAGRYIIEEPFYPTLINPASSILAGFSPNTAFPLLVGHNGTTLKADATEIMRTPQGYPLLATRRYGIGRTVAWTSSLSARWASDWLAWGGFSDFAAQLVAWSFPDPETGNLVVRTRQEGSATFIDINASDEEGHPVSAETKAIIVAPDSSSSELTVPQVGAGEYQIELPSDGVGAYFVTVSQRDENGEPLASNTRGLVVPYSPEYRLQESDQTLLTQITEQTKGKLRFLSEPAAAFEHPSQPVSRAQPLSPWLIALALLLFPFDIATRRLMLGQRELERARTWLITRLSSQIGQAQAPQEPILGSLLQAKERARGRMTPPPKLGGAEGRATGGMSERASARAGKARPKSQLVAEASDAPRGALEPSAEEADTADTLSRLRRLKLKRDGEDDRARI